MSFFGKIFSVIIPPPVSYDEEQKKAIASYLSIFLVVAISILPVYVVIKIAEEGTLIPSDYINFGLALVLAALLFLIRKGKILLSGVLFLFIAWSAMTAMAWYADGVQDMAIVAYILIIFLATLFSGIRFASLITVMSIISVWVFGIMQTRNILIPTGDEPLNYSRDYTVIFILVLTAIILLARNFRNSLDRVNRELNERIKAEEKLSEKELNLLEKNIELMASMEKAEESDRLKTAFLQNISHELRTPMNGIVGFLGLLQQVENDNEKQVEYMKVINSCTMELASLVNDLIDISVIESGAIALNVSQFSSDELLSDIENNFSKKAAQKGLSFIIENEINGISIKSDLGKIKQILNNLVSNAIKFTPSGSVSVKVSRINKNLLISVADTGIGIDDSLTDVIFARFRQGETGLDRVYGGSGLGLAISKGNVDFLGGKIWVESQPGSGSVFTFRVPVEFGTEMIISTYDNIKIEIREGLKILVVDDDEISYLYIKELMKTSAVQIMWAMDGNEALDIFRKNNDLDIVLMDLRMHGMTGSQAAKEIKNIKPSVPIVAISAFALQEETEKPSGTNFDGYVVKPIIKNDLMLKISKALR